MIVIRHDATVNMLWKKFAFENLKANSETKVLAKTPCKTLKQMAKNKNAMFLSVVRFWEHINGKHKTLQKSFDEQKIHLILEFQ